MRLRQSEFHYLVRRFRWWDHDSFINNPKDHNYRDLRLDDCFGDGSIDGYVTERVFGKFSPGWIL